MHTPAIIVQHPSAPVHLDDPREQSVEAPSEGLPVLGHSEPIRLLDLRTEGPAGTCTACLEPVAWHFDTTGCLYIGCAGVSARKALAALRRRPLRETTEWGDSHPVVSAAVRDAFRAGCGPEVALFFESLGAEERINLSRRMADLAVVAYLRESSR